jgi:predicted histone-like DNA-binding protein
MSIRYRLLKNEIKSSPNYGKYYAHTVRSGHVSLEEIEKEVERSCSATAADVRMVVRELFETVKHYMQYGYVVQLGDLGSFSISVKSMCVDTKEEFRSDHHIKGFKCNYTPAGHRRRPENGKRQGSIERGMLEGCKVEHIKE